MEVLCHWSHLKCVSNVLQLLLMLDVISEKDLHEQSI